MTKQQTTPSRKPPVDYIERTRVLYGSMGFDAYGWQRRQQAPAFAPLKKPLHESRLGLFGSGGIYEVGQVAFHYRDDISFRVIDTGCDTKALRATHFAYDLTDARSDPNVVFPIEPLRSLVAQGELGELSANAYAFMGGVYSARKVEERLAPELVKRALDDQIDLALLVPV